MARRPPTAAASKPALRAALIAQLEAALETARAAHAAAVEGATHEEARAENDKDTRGLEQSYLARGHANRVAELEAGLAAVTALALRAFAAADRIGLGALVTAEDEDGARRRFLLAPAGGGLVLPDEVTVVTPTSPIGGALLGKTTGDDCEVRIAGGVRSLTVIEVG